MIFVSLGLWVLFEIMLVVRDRLRRAGPASADRGTRILNGFLVVGTVIVAADVSQSTNAFNTPARMWFRSVGLILIWLGMALRLWSVVTLGANFRTTVKVSEHQPVVADGPYRWVRHPSYTGMLVIAFGFGVGFASWLPLGLCAVLPPLALLRRIQIEEYELVQVLGEPYRSYQSRTKRLIPGIW